MTMQALSISTSHMCFLTILLGIGLVPQARASAMKDSIKWSKKNDLALRLGNFGKSPGHYFRKKGQKSPYLLLSDTTEKKEKISISPYFLVERIPNGLYKFGIWAHRTEGCSRRQLTVGKGYDGSLRCDIDWLSPDGELLATFQDVSGIWQGYDPLEIRDGPNPIHPPVVAMMEVIDGHTWYQFLNIQQKRVTTPSLPDVLFLSIGEKQHDSFVMIGQDLDQSPSIPLPNGEVWPIGSDGFRVGDAGSIDGYDPVFQGRDEGIWGYRVRHTVEGETRWGFADADGATLLGATFAALTVADDGWFHGVDPSGQHVVQPLEWHSEWIGVGATEALARAAALQEMADRKEAERLAQIAAEQDALAKRKAQEAYLAAEAEKRRIVYNSAEAVQRRKEADWCEQVVGLVERSGFGGPPLGALDRAVRTCDRKLSPDNFQLIQQANQEALGAKWEAERASQPKERLTWGQKWAAMQIQASPRYSSYNNSYSSSNASNPSDDAAQSIAVSEAQAARADRKFDQFIEYISGASTYDPSRPYRR